MDVELVAAFPSVRKWDFFLFCSFQISLKLSSDKELGVFFFPSLHFFSTFSVILTGTAGWGSGTWARPGLYGSWPGVLPLLQVIVQSGRHPTVLQKLCQLPFQYFSDPRLIKVLFPSLIAACYNNLQNKIILEQEMSCVLLATFIQVPSIFTPNSLTLCES